MKKFFGFLKYALAITVAGLSMATIISVSPLGNWTSAATWTDSGNYTTTFTLGNGSESSPYIVQTVKQLAGIAKAVNANSPTGRDTSYYKLASNLDLNAYEWTPIGTSSRPFKGNFDGNGYIITGINVVKGTSNYSGFFGKIQSATIKNTMFDGTNSQTSANSYVGGIVGYALNSTLTGMSNNISVTTTATTVGVGGIVGFAEGSTIEKVYNTAKIDSSASNGTAGIVGFALNSEVDNTFNRGQVKNTATGVTSAQVGTGGIIGITLITLTTDIFCMNNYNTAYISGLKTGGIVGANLSYISNYGSGNTDKLWITRSYNLGTVSSSDISGGIIGLAYNANLVRCYNTGTITGDSSVGGIAGNGGGSITIVSNSGTISGRIGVGGIVGSTSFSTGWGIIGPAYNLGTVSATDKQAGGILGASLGHGGVESPTILDCSNSGTISAKNGYVGGLIGKASYTIYTSFNTGTVSSSSGGYVGGILGSSEISKGMSVSWCYNTGSITGVGNTGGIIGYYEEEYDDYTMFDCYNVGVVSSSNTNYVGSLIGRNYHDKALNDNCYWLSGTRSYAFGTSNGGTDSSNGKPTKLSYSSDFKNQTFANNINDGLNYYSFINTSTYVTISTARTTVLTITLPTDIWTTSPSVNSGNPIFKDMYW